MKHLQSRELRERCDPDQLDFETTDELPLQGGNGVTSIGQQRAQEAFRVGTGIADAGYNLYVMGPAGAGRHSFVSDALRGRARNEAPPPDLCYVNHFARPHRPKALRLPAGTGSQLKRDMERLLEEIRSGLAAVFEGQEYREKKRAIEGEIKELHDFSFRELERRAEEKGVKLARTPEGFVILPPEEGADASEEKRERAQRDASGFHDDLHAFLQNIPEWAKSARERIKELDRAMAAMAVERMMAGMFSRYSGVPTALDFLGEVKADIIRNFSDFLRVQEPAGGTAAILSALAGAPALDGDSVCRRYQVNLLVENEPGKGAPVIYEDNPTYQNLVGRVEHLAQMGTLVTDFNLIKPGAFHRASGGYLVLDADKLLLQPFAWEGLKRALRSGQVRVESPGQLVGAMSTVSLEPEPVPGVPRVVLIGERFLFYLLNHLDPDFRELFKVSVDFEEELSRTSEAIASYSALIGGVARNIGLRSVSRAAVAYLVEESARIAGDAEKLTTKVGLIHDLLREADYWAGEFRHEVIGADDIQRALDARVRRSARMRDRLIEETCRGSFVIETDGKLTGCVNGLSYVDQGNFAFGHPVRITARVRIGRGDVIDIEREVRLGGPIHSKGVLILAGFLGSRYAPEVPLSLAATLVFEQSYGPVEGDSASAAELFALLSALAELPVEQSFAITGSINQNGDVQAISGANEKIEGFFDLCRKRGLSGRQGVLIPASNVKNLMLRRDVVDAAENGRFSVFAIHHVDEGIELLTGVPAESVNRMVRERLIEFARKRREFGLPSDQSRAA